MKGQALTIRQFTKGLESHEYIILATSPEIFIIRLSRFAKGAAPRPREQKISVSRPPLFLLSWVADFFIHAYEVLLHQEPPRNCSCLRFTESLNEPLKHGKHSMPRFSIGGSCVVVHWADELDSRS